MPSRRRSPVDIACLVLLGAILWRPVSNNQLLIPLLALFGASCTARLVLRGRRVHGSLYPLVFAQMAFALVGIAVGWRSSTPGLSAGMLVYVAGPILWWLWTVSHDLDQFRRVLATVVYVSIVVSAAITLFALAQKGLLPNLLPQGLLAGQGAGFGEGVGSTEVRFYGLSTLTASGPICLAIAMLPAHRLLPSRRAAMAGAVLAVCAALLAGRRAQVIVLLLTPLAVLLLSRLIGKVSRQKARSGPIPRWLVGVYATVIGVGLGFGSGALSARIIQVSLRSATSVLFGSVNSADDQVRVEQSARLLGEWARSPLYGRGFGATIDGYTRSADRPWNFELQYHLLLFQTGLLGALLLAAAVYIVLRGARHLAVSSSDLRAPLIVALTGAGAMAFANASNPYLQAPGHMWAIYLPLIVLNAGWLSLPEQHQRHRQSLSAKPQEDQPPANLRLSGVSRGAVTVHGERR